ncbi:ABC transporter permease subunit [Mesorhizobium sp. CAU 1741]|uniref:ABC transporter permease n=1 Tax=Mesorhizobium sp. CAU 1741 TaxID=3140366 RepID=UPI00325B6DFE
MTALAERPAAHLPSGITGAVGVLLAWELAARALDGTYLLAGPVSVAAYLMENAGLVSRALAVTFESAALGFVIGNLVAIALALMALLVPRAERLVAAVALFVSCLPFVATGPILRVIGGPGTAPQITLAALAVYYVTFLTLMVGLRASPSAWLDLVRSYGRNRWTEIVQVRARASLPYLIAGLQITAPAAFLGAMVGEFTGAERGMGVLAIRAMRGLDVTATWALATVASATAILVYAGIGWIGRRLNAAPPPIILSAPPPETRSSALGSVGSWLLLGAVATCAILLLWAGLMELFGLNEFFAKRPWHVFDFLVTASDAADHRAALFSALLETMYSAAPGYLLGLLLGAGLAVIVVSLPALASTVLPTAIALRSIPIITTAPLIVLALGRGSVGTITIVAIMIFFPTLVACVEGMRQAPAPVIDLFRTYSASRWTSLRLARIPAMLPAFFASARIAVPAAILAATVAEWLATGTGIGSLMAISASTSAYAMLWSSIVVVAALSAASYGLVSLVERRVLTVYASEQLSR